MSKHNNNSRLFYLVGASGSGKDSVIKGVRKFSHQGDFPFFIAHRYITREETGDEGSVYLSEEEFLLREKNGLFSMSWQANGLRYGIGVEVDQWLESGFSVLVNGSRAYLPSAKSKYSDSFHSVLVDVPIDELRARLLKRAREDEAAIEKRIERHQSLLQTVSCDSKLQNVRSIDSSAAKLQEIMQEVMSSQRVLEL